MKSKPARVGLWHFQGAVPLQNGLPYIAHTKLNNANKAAGETSHTVYVMTEWADAVLKHNPNSVLFMDSYYMSKAGLEMVREKCLKVIAALNTGRFKRFKKHMESKVKNAGETSYLHNNQTGETIMFHWSINSNIGKKMTYSTCFKVEKGKQPPNTIPIFDHYNAGFNRCDRFNQQMHGKTWPFKSGGKNRHGMEGNTMNYWFTTTLVNGWNAFAATRAQGQSDENFKDYCCDLAIEQCRCFNEQ